MAQRILDDDWSDYDNKKISGKRDENRFSCEEDWEVNYLTTKIHQQHPGYSTQEIREAILVICSSTPDRRRATFVKSVMTRLRSELTSMDIKALLN